LNSTSEKQKEKNLIDSGRKFGDNRLNTGENYPATWLRYATDHKETLKNSTITTKVVGPTFDQHMFLHPRLDASMTPEHTSIGHFLNEKPS
jgi:hypothetical protein